MPASNSVDPGYAFLVSAVDSAFSENDLCTLIAAAAEDRWLVDSATGSVRVMDDEGHEANRASRDPQMWTASAVDGCYVVMYGPRGVALVRERLGDLAPREADMAHIEAEKVELASTSVEGLAKHQYKLAWRLQWIEQEQRFRLQQSDIPQLWCVPPPTRHTATHHPPPATVLPCAYARKAGLQLFPTGRAPAPQVGCRAECHRATQGRGARAQVSRRVRRGAQGRAL